MTFYVLKTRYVNVHSKSNKQKNFIRIRAKMAWTRNTDPIKT